jgi:hypothetical protein
MFLTICPLFQSVDNSVHRSNKTVPYGRFSRERRTPFESRVGLRARPVCGEADGTSSSGAGRRARAIAVQIDGAWLDWNGYPLFLIRILDTV